MKKSGPYKKYLKEIKNKQHGLMWQHLSSKQMVSGKRGNNGRTMERKRKREILSFQSKILKRS